MIEIDGLSADLERAKGVTADQKEMIREYLNKYMMLMGQDPSTTRVVIKDNVGSKWLGRTMWWTNKPDTTVIELQKRILFDPRSLERVIAHEVVHHVEFTTFDAETIEAFKRGARRPPSHGNRFHAFAKFLNERVGDDAFVTQTSDETYTIGESRPFYLLVVPLENVVGPSGRDRYAYMWSAGAPRSVSTADTIRRLIAERGARLLKTTHSDFARGPKIGSGNWGSPQEEERQDLLRQMYEQAG